MTNLAKNIRYLRLSRGMSQTDLAARLGKKSYTTIQKWETGVAEPSIANVAKIAQMFDVSVDDITMTDLQTQSTPQWQEYTEYEYEQRQEEKWRLSDFMNKMLKYYHAFNEDGQEHILQTCEDMLQIERFRKEKR